MNKTMFRSHFKIAKATTPFLQQIDFMTKFHSFYSVLWILFTKWCSTTNPEMHAITYSTKCTVITFQCSGA